MKICVTADGDNLDARVDARFGRCKYFLFIDTDTMEYEAVENPYREAPQGAGVQSAQLVVNKGAKKIITGNVGPGAQGILSSAGVEVIFKSGIVKDVIKDL
jgi:predicted Fe-Mo cluster-binding NifX family protein